MKPFLTCWPPLPCWPYVPCSALAQTPATDAKQFAKDGLSFSYPNGWTLEDESNDDAQNYNIGRADSEAQMRVFVFRTPVNYSRAAGGSAKGFGRSICRFDHAAVSTDGRKTGESAGHDSNCECGI